MQGVSISCDVSAFMVGRIGLSDGVAGMDAASFCWKTPCAAMGFRVSPSCRERDFDPVQDKLPREFMPSSNRLHIASGCGFVG
jgi:hypothetical protein